jgi:prepilin-type N-terminal cleavage/methylation domain-containing protein
MKKYCGFTLPEVLITLTLASLLFLLAVPSFSYLRHRQQINYISYALQQSIAYARLQAVVRYETILIIPQEEDWQKGWHIALKKNNLILRNFPPMPLKIIFSSGHNNIQIMSNGMTEGHQCHFKYGDIKLVLNRGGRTYIETEKPSL